MQHKLIKTDNYLLVVDDSEIKEGDYCTTHLNIIDVGKIHNSYTIFHPTTKEHLNDLKSCKKIIAHLPLNNSPILEGVPLLPPIEDDVEKLANKWAIDNADITMESNSALNKGFKGGYNKAKEKYKYTEEDMRIAIQQAFLCGVERLEDFGKVESMIIGNIQQPKLPVAFACEEIEIVELSVGVVYGHTIIGIEAKTITNSQGQTQLVGTYIYE
jgi:hypothetical protein